MAGNKPARPVSAVGMQKRAEVQVVVRWGESVVHVATAAPAALRREGVRALGLHRFEGMRDERIDVGARDRVFVRGVELPADASASVVAGELLAELSWTRPEDAVSAVPASATPGLAESAPRPLLSNGLSICLHAALVAALWFFASPPDESELTAERVELFARLDASASSDAAEGEADGGASDHRTEESRPGAAHPTPRRPNEGVAGEGMSATTRGEHHGAAASVRRRSEAMADAQEFGMIGLLREGFAGPPLSPGPTDPSSGFGLDAPSDAIPGAGPEMWGADMTPSAGGLGLSGVGEGGAGTGYGVGLGTLSILGEGDRALANDAALAVGSGRLSGSHRTRGTRCGCGGARVSGRLPAEVIQRVVRQNFGRFRGCWSPDQLARDSTGGRVSVAFVIGLDGAVSSASLVETAYDLPPGVRSCVVRQFGGLSFPAPEGGIVRVTYPIVFEAAP